MDATGVTHSLRRSSEVTETVPPEFANGSFTILAARFFPKTIVPGSSLQTVQYKPPNKSQQGNQHYEHPPASPVRIVQSPGRNRSAGNSHQQKEACRQQSSFCVCPSTVCTDALVHKLENIKQYRNKNGI